jgi:hypothetical protein
MVSSNYKKDPFSTEYNQNVFNTIEQFNDVNLLINHSLKVTIFKTLIRIYYITFYLSYILSNAMYFINQKNNKGNTMRDYSNKMNK